MAPKVVWPPGAQVLLLGAPPGFAVAHAASAPQSLAHDAAAGLPAQHYDMVVLFASDAATLEASTPAAGRALRPGGVLWVAYPKPTDPAQPPALTREALHPLMAPLGWRAVQQGVLGAGWAAMRFKRQRGTAP